MRESAEDGFARSVAVLGLGLIGGSLARDLALLGWRVLGHDLDTDTVASALAEGVLAAALGPGLEGIEDAAVVVIAAPITAIPSILAAVVGRTGPDTLVTDVGSTKRTTLEAALAAGIGARFVGGHPLAGDHRAGWRASRSGLFEDARVFLCPCQGTAQPMIERADALWRSVGGVPRLLDGEAHDRLLAWVSHLPQATSSAMAVALGEAGIGPGELGPGGRDMLRLAGSGAELWTDIALDNARALSAACAELEARLAALRKALETEDRSSVSAFFHTARSWAAGGSGAKVLP